MAGNKNWVWMELNVDLNCTKCFKNIKEILAENLDIRDQVYEKEKNIVRIKAVGCCPERIRDKLCLEGKNVIKSIEIVASQGGVAIGEPIPAKYWPFQPGYGCPVCPGNKVYCPCCHGYGKV